MKKDGRNAALFSQRLGFRILRFRRIFVGTRLFVFMGRLVFAQTPSSLSLLLLQAQQFFLSFGALISPATFSQWLSFSSFFCYCNTTPDVLIGFFKLFSDAHPITEIKIIVFAWASTLFRPLFLIFFQPALYHRSIEDCRS